MENERENSYAVGHYPLGVSSEKKMLRINVKFLGAVVSNYD